MHRFRDYTVLLIVLAAGGYGVQRWRSGAESEGKLPVAARMAEVRAGESAVPGPPIEIASALQLTASAATNTMAVTDAAVIDRITKIYTAGDYEVARRQLMELLQAPDTSAGLRGWVKSQLPIVLVSLGWKKLKDGDCIAAMECFVEAIRKKPIPEGHKGLAYCHYRFKEFRAADEHFSSYLATHPGDWNIAMLYADALESEQRYQDAVNVLAAIDPEQISEVPAQASLKKRLAAMRQRLGRGDKQLSVTSAHFSLTYSADQHEHLVSSTLEILEQALEEYVGHFNMRYPQATIEVLYYEQNDFKEVTIDTPLWAQGVFDGRIRVPISPKLESESDIDAYGLRLVLRHELVHAMLANMSGFRVLPTWFEEGLAQRLSCHTPGCGVFQYDVKPGDFLGIEAFGLAFIKLPAAQAQKAYKQSYFLVAVLEKVIPGDDNIQRVLRALDPQTPVITADGLLSPVNRSFAKLRETAVETWRRGKRLALD